MAGRQLASKWLKTEALLTDRRIVPYIPHTMILSPSHLQYMLRKYRMVVVKPIVGGGGYGVIRMTKDSKGYTLTHLSQTIRHTHFHNIYLALNRMKAQRKYLIQQGIYLATIKGRPIDYRVKMVKVHRHWVFRSMVGRLAKPGLFITNLCKGGTQLTCLQGLKASRLQGSSHHKCQEMRKLSIICTGIMERHFPGINELGFDYGVDVNNRIWIFEVNTRPQ
ncbi:YheC/YheD family protein [Paenibacillus sp. IHBB 10380]|uniref:YheC/YheD family protein n=1 Tax=Paenibacillus sp. IHBB 10380 TaxID=1566358 RepID=UPI0005CFA48C|nr:YheC/YheD family protein [Paenibacillus sp. IHBB 10380]AJS57416.1 hypothetical protein UB51_01705 [Paenibacillus sp. IHBB 10380]